MPWLKLLHIAAVTLWCGALLYLPALVSAAAAGPGVAQPLRAVYIAVATPAALVAIASGTWIFAAHGPLEPWLVFKLALVSLLVLGHGVCGVLVLRSGRGEHTGLPTAAALVMATTLLSLVGIAALVLRKPEWP